MCFSGKYVVQDQESRRFHHHKITAASRYAWSTDCQQDLINCCGWLSFIEPALFRSVYLGNSLWTFKYRDFVVAWRSWWPWCFHCITSDSEECSPLCASCLDRNAQWKFHCANWLLPIEFFIIINESFSVPLKQVQRQSAAAFPKVLLNTSGTSYNLKRAVMVRTTRRNLGAFGGIDLSIRDRQECLTVLN